MPDETNDQPQPKACLECATANATDATTCAGCGGASFPDIVAQQDADAAICAEREARTENDEQARKRRAQEAKNRALHGDAEPKDAAQLLAWWNEGWRPDGMCKDCPQPGQPCRGCFALAGYPARQYDERWPAEKPAPAPETLPAPASTDEVPPPAPDAALVGITPLGVEVMQRIAALPADVERNDALLERVTAEVRAERAAVQDDVPTKPSAVEGTSDAVEKSDTLAVGATDVDPNAPPGNHDGDEPEPTDTSDRIVEPADVQPAVPEAPKAKRGRR